MQQFFSHNLSGLRAIAAAFSLFAASAVAAHESIGSAGTMHAATHTAVQQVELDGSLEFTLTIGAWIPRLDGNVKLGGASGEVGTRFELGPDLRLNDTELTILPELAIRKQEVWEMHFSGFRFSTDSRGTFDRSGSFGDLQLDAGDAFRSEFDITSAAGEFRLGLYRAYTKECNGNLIADGRQKVDVRFSPLIGIRYVEVEHTVERIGGGREDAGGTWVIPYGGFRMELTYFPDGALPVVRMLRLEAGAAFGPALGADGGFAWQVRAGLTCNVTDNLGFMFGYRLLELEVENGPYEFNGGLQGLFLAGSLRF